MNKKLISAGIAAVLLIIGFMIFNPIAYNEPTERTVYTQMDGSQDVQFLPGFYYAGFFAKSEHYPNQVSVAYGDTTFDGDLELHDNTVEIGPVKMRFSDATEAYASGIVQYLLPNNKKEMLTIHNSHRNITALVSRRLAPYTKECLQSCAQLMTSEMHYSGGRAQMTQDYLDQLKNGTYLLNIKESIVYDTTDNSNRRTYLVNITRDKNGQPMRKFSSIKEYSITLGDAQITNVDYSDQVKEMLRKKIQAATEASVSKQKLMTAEQQRLTAEAEGKKKLTEIEYIQKQEQTKQVVQAETQVELAKQDKEKQRIAAEAAELEARKVKTLADAEAYAKAKVMAADGALEKKLATYERVSNRWAEAFEKHQNPLTPTFMTGSGPVQNAGTTFMELMNAKAQMDLMLNMKTK